MKSPQSIVINHADLLSLTPQVYWIICSLACWPQFSTTLPKCIVPNICEQLLIYALLKSLNIFAVYLFVKMWYSILEYQWRYADLLTYESFDNKMLTITSLLVLSL